jgi:hypothetical protein
VKDLPWWLRKSLDSWSKTYDNGKALGEVFKVE